MANFGSSPRTPTKQDIAFTVEQWAIRDEARQFEAYSFAHPEALPQQLDHIVEVEMPQTWSAFQERHESRKYTAATQLLLNLTFDSRRAAMCQPLSGAKPDVDAANMHSRQLLHGTIRDANLEPVMFSTYNENFMDAMRWTNLAVSIKTQKGVEALVKRALGLTCNYVSLYMSDTDYFFPAPGRDLGELVPYDEFEQYRQC